MDSYVVAIEGLADSRPLESLPKKLLTAAARTLNRTADRTRTRAAREILQQVALPASYLNPSGNRLTVTKKARADDLEAVISGRQRPTSLARFSGNGSPGSAGVQVTVAPGFAKFMKRAFLIRLRAGTADLDTKSNLGLAMRLRPGESPSNKKKMVQMQNGLWLLYGPSVDQVFQSVREDVSPEAMEFAAAEFARLMELDL